MGFHPFQIVDGVWERACVEWSLEIHSRQVLEPTAARVSFGFPVLDGGSEVLYKGGMELQIAWHAMSPSESVEEEARRRFEKLLTFFDQIHTARLSIDQSGSKTGQSHVFDVVLELHVPGREIVVSHSPQNDRHDLHRLVHHAFDAARRQLQDYNRIRQGKIKHHA